MIPQNTYVPGLLLNESERRDLFKQCPYRTTKETILRRRKQSQLSATEARLYSIAMTDIEWLEQFTLKRTGTIWTT